MERLSNVTEVIEKQRLGYRVSKQLDLAYSKLKCLAGDLKFFYDSQGERLYCPVFSSKFCHLKNQENFLVSANEDGKIILMNTNAPTGKKVVSSFQAHDNAIFDLVWTNYDMNFISISGDHSATLWQVSEGNVTTVSQFCGHNHSVKAVSCKPDDRNVFSTGGRDGAIMVWDTRVPDLCDKVINHSHEEGFLSKRSFRAQVNSVTGLVFQDENNLISCSAGDGLIKVWDMRKTYCMYKRLPQAKHILPYDGIGRNGFSYLSISPCRLRLYANCIDHHIYCYDIGTYSKKPIAQYGSHFVSSYYIQNSVSPDGRYIASGSNDGKAYVWSINNQLNPLVSLSGHANEVTGVDWCKAGELKMVTCSDDATLRVWRVHPQEMACNDPNLRGWAERYINAESRRKDSYGKKRKYYTSYGISIDRPRECENIYPDTVQQAEKKQCLDSTLDMSSLTADLPNYVIDGTSPHVHHCSHPPKKNTNWLSRFRKKASEVNSKPQQIGNKRKSTGSSPGKGSILRFFKVTSRSPSLDQPNISASDTKKTIPSVQS